MPRQLLNVTIHKGRGDWKVVEYDCPKCRHHNTHLWFGREDHYCTQCGEVTHIHGETAPAEPVPA